MFESNDTFIEEAVKSQDTSAEKMKKYGSLALTIIFAVLTFIGVFTIISLILCIGFLILTIILMGNKNIEYEYDYTNGSLEIAKIIDNSKRKRILSVESSQIKLVAAEGTNESLRFGNVQLKEYNCSANDSNRTNYIMVAHDEKKNADFKIIFNPSEKLLNAMKKYNRDVVYFN